MAKGIEETDSLDWKTALPDKGPEFAKDVAAMANSGGGLIVYGVKEVEGESSAAGDLCGVSGWGDREERRLRAIAYSAVQPPIHGLIFTPIPHGGGHLVALSIQASPDAPHLVWGGTAFTAPIRYGAQTEFMRERDLERAYQARFRERSLLGTALEERLHQAEDRLDATSRIWMVATAVPLQGRPAHLGRIPREAAREMLTQFKKGNPFSEQRLYMPGFSENPRAGLRRWTSTDKSVGAGISGLVEIHDDGGISLATHRPASPASDLLDNHLHIKTVQDFAADVIWLTRVASSHLGIDSAYALRITLLTDLRPLYIRAWDPYGFAVDLDLVTPINRFIPVDATVDPTTPMSALLELVRDVATDLVNQGGISDIGSRYIRETMPENASAKTKNQP